MKASTTVKQLRENIQEFKWKILFDVNKQVCLQKKSRKETLRDFFCVNRYYLDKNNGYAHSVSIHLGKRGISMAKVGENISWLRKQNHMTQDELAEKLYVSRQTISNYEKGKTNPDIDTLVRIAEIFQTDVDTLIRDTQAEKGTERKKEIRDLLWKAVILVVGAILIQILQDKTRLLAAILMTNAPKTILNITLVPIYYIFAGWTFMQGILTLFHVRYTLGTKSRYVRYFVIICLVFYAMNLTPICIQEIIWNAQMIYKVYYQHLEYSINASYPLPHWWYFLTELFIRISYGYSAVFLIPGILLRLTGEGKAKESRTKNGT